MFIRFLGLLNRAILSRLIGTEGLGFFQIIIPVYTLLIEVAGAGLPGAITKMIADRHSPGNVGTRILIKNKAIKIVLVSSILTMLIYYPLLSMYTLHSNLDGRIVSALKIVAAGILFASVSQIVRGFFQGNKMMTPTAVSQMGEQICRVGSGLVGAYVLMPFGLEYALCGITAGIVFGEIIGFIILLLYRRFHLRKVDPCGTSSPATSERRLGKEMAALSLPLLLLRVSGSVTHVFESLLIPARLQKAGFSAAESIALLGELAGMALPLLFLPTVFILPFNTVLVPYVAQAAVAKQKKTLNNIVRFSLWGTLGMGFLFSLIFRFFSPTLTSLLYGNSTAAPLVTMLSLCAPLVYMQFTTASILHGLGYPGVAVLNDLAGTAVGLLLIYFLTALPSMGINGAVWAYSASFALTSLLGCVSSRFLISGSIRR
ncbi:MAG: polysaccharide biosynthesis protein [Firmicutes bacterium]|nr:polysaccharide biosynthesis protein [Bacillota bacterium]